MRTTRPRVVIVGAGFGGLRAARALAEAPVDVLLLDRNNYHLFQPLLYQVAVGALPPSEIAYPVRSIMRRQRNLEFRVASVSGFDLAGHTVSTSRGDVPYDHLIIAAGAATNTFGLDDVAENGFDLKGLPSALRLRNHLMRCFESAIASADPTARRALLTIAVAGGGPTGVEVAGAVSELLRRVLARDYGAIPRGEISVVLLEAGTRVLASMPERLSRAAASSLAALGVEVRTGAAVASYDGTTVRLAKGGSLAARTLVWAAGVKASPLTSTLDVPRHASGRVIVEPTLEVKGHPDVYAIGDAAYLETPAGPVPMLAPPAMQMGACAARNVMHTVAGEPLEAFLYKDPGTMATIGRSAAVVALGRVELRGFLAWLFWLFVHLVQLIGFRNKLVVLVDWAWQYLFYRPASTLILEDDEPGGRSSSGPTLQYKELDKSRSSP
jgi:NADH:quinone reductase (non-electrogenic)